VRQLVSFGSPDELPRIKFGRAYREAAGDPPDWRITCFFVDRNYRHKGVAAAALKGALSEIARLGGGTVESSPEDVEGRKVSNSFLYNATVSMFEEQGFARTRRLGKNTAGNETRADAFHGCASRRHVERPAAARVSWFRLDRVTGCSRTQSAELARIIALSEASNTASASS
jgi:GNAT superfamily N-acetyltransferase